jgi:hypothetical protein
MKPDNVPEETINAYLLRVKEKLRDLPSAQVAEILTELRSHVLDSANLANGGMTDATMRETLARLGPPEDLAEMYLTENLLETAGATRSPWLVMQTLFRLALHSAWALGIFFLSLTGYLFAIGFLVCAVAKPFNPTHVGLWWNTQSHTLVAFGLIWPEPFDREVLGWWIIPVGLILCGLTFFLTTRFARWNIRRIRRSRRTHFAQHGIRSTGWSSAASLR